MTTWKEAAKYFGRYLIQLPGKYEPGSKPHIFLFSTRRSGSTLLRDMIYTQRGYNYIDQPFDLHQFNPHKKLLPELPSSQVVFEQEQDYEKIKHYLDQLLTRKAVYRSQWDIFSDYYNWQWEAYVVKILNAKVNIDWFKESFDAKIIYSVRHPVATSFSIMNRNWGFTTSAYLNNETFVKKYLSEAMLELSYEVEEHGELLDRHVLNWCLENLEPLRLWKERDWLTISYERMVLDPAHTAKRICESCNLPDYETMMAVTDKPSRTTLKGSRADIKANGSESRMASWMKKIDSETSRRLTRILDTFKIDLYTMDDPFPQKEFDEKISLVREKEPVI